MGIVKQNFNLKKNFQLYKPKEITPKLNMPDYVSENLQLLVRFETSTKLNLVANDGTLMIQEENEADTEIHFALFESEMDQYELNLLKMFKKTVKKMTNPGIKFGPWVMVDFDHYLKGNPLV